MQTRFDTFRGLGGTVGTSISALFLFTIAAANMVVAIQVYRFFRAATAARTADMIADTEAANGGLLARFFRPAFTPVRGCGPQGCRRSASRRGG
jgi:high-affinity nickel-transport protein